MRQPGSTGKNRVSAGARSPRMEQKQQEARRRIMEAAHSLFTRQSGYEKTTVRQIAAKADVSVGAVYLHFKSKPDILAALVTDFFAVNMSGITLTVSPEGSGREQLKGLLSNFARFAADRNTILFAQLMARVGLQNFDKQVDEVIIVNITRLLDVITGIISRGVEDGSFHLGDRHPRMIAVVFLQCFQGLVTSMFADQRFRSGFFAGFSPEEIFKAGMDIMYSSVEGPAVAEG